MVIYEHPDLNLRSRLGGLRKRKPGFSNWVVLLLAIFLSSSFGFAAGLIGSSYYQAGGVPDFIAIEEAEKEGIEEIAFQRTQEEAVVEAVKEASPAVVSIVITKEVAIFEEYYLSPFDIFPQYKQKGTEEREIGGGSGFIVSESGIVVTNKHVASEEGVNYTVFTKSGDNYPAEVLARDPVQDLAILRIKQEDRIGEEGNLEKKSFPVVKLGNSDDLQIGQTVIAIGNALGEFKNTVSVGVVSGLGREITAAGGGVIETLEGVIQTDAAINQGNSGGPLLNLDGEVVGINTAMVQQAQNIGFAIPIKKAKRDIEQVKETGKIVYPFLGIRYVLITKGIKEKNDLPVDRGAWVVKGGEGEFAIYPGSAAEKAGIREGDIILEFAGEEITSQNALSEIIMKFNPGDEVSLKILRGEKEISITAVLGEKSG